jgi:hypothetical protein
VKSKAVWLFSGESGLVEGRLVFNVVEAAVDECKLVGTVSEDYLRIPSFARAKGGFSRLLTACERV